MRLQSYTPSLTAVIVVLTHTRLAPRRYCNGLAIRPPMIEPITRRLHPAGRVGLASICTTAFSILDLTASLRQAITLAGLFLLANLSLGFVRSFLSPQPSAKLIALRRTDSGRSVAVAVDQPPEEGIRSPLSQAL